MSQATIAELESAFVKADSLGNTEDARVFADALRLARAEASKPPEGVELYKDVVPEEVRQQEQERLEAPPVSVNPMAAGGGALTQQMVQNTTDFLRYMGFTEFGEKKTVEGVGETTRAEELGYQLKRRGGSSAGRLLLTAEAYSPSRYKMMRNPDTGRLEQVSAETYYDNALRNQGITGQEFLDMKPELREDILLQNKELAAREAYEVTADVLDIAGEDETMKATATILSEVADPLLIPTVIASGGGTVPLLLAGTGYGLATEGSRQMIQDEIDVERLAESALYGGLFTAAFAPLQTAGLAYKTAVRTPLKGLEKGGKRVLNIVNNTRATKGSTATANKIAEKLQERTAYHLFNTKQANGKGVTNKQAVALAEKDLSLNAKNKIDVLKYASKDKRPSYLSKENAAKIMANLDNPAASTTKIGKAWDYIGAPISQAIRNVDQRLAGAVRNHDMKTSIALANSMKEAEGFNNLMRKAFKTKDSALKSKYYEMELALNNGQTLKASNIAKKYFGDLKFKTKSGKELNLADEMRNINKLLDNIHTRANKAGIKMAYLTNYMPRYVKDLDGLRQAVGKKTNSVIDEALATEAKKRGLGHWSELDDEVAADIITQAITRKTPPSGKKRLESARTIRTIPQHLQKYYHDTPTALQLYINKAEREIAKHEFFGKSVAYNKAGKIELDESIENSLGKHVLDMKKRGKELTNEQENDLRLLLKARFEAADKAMGKTMASVRDLQYAALLGQFDSALIQLGDIGSSLYLNGVMNTAKALATGNKRAKITADDLGLVNQVSAELNNLNGMTKFLDFALTYSGFRKIDKLGKDTFIKAAWRKNTKLARTNPDAIAKKYGDVFENETADLIADLQAGRMTDNTKLLMWNELADVQPIALSEMPQAYLKMTNGRILYSLKSFGLKQLNLIRQNIVKRGQRGDVTGAFEEALKYSLLVGMGNGSVENARKFLLSGFDEDAIRDIDDVTYESLAKIFFLSKYSRDKYLSKGQYGTFVAELFTPAAPSVIDTLGAAMNNVLFEQENDTEAFNKAMKVIPVAGKSYYYLMGGGAEKIIEQVEREEREE